MDIGIGVGDVRGAVDATGLLEQAEQAQRAGIDTVWAAQGVGWDSLTALAAIGGRLPRLRLGKIGRAHV